MEEDDAAELLSLQLALDDETDLMLLEPGERPQDVETERQKIVGVLDRPNQTVMVAEANGALVGYIAVLGGRFRRNRHCAHVVMGVRQEFRNRGVGTGLLMGAERWARQCETRRLELTVMAHNTRAIHPYEKTGFVREGTRRHSLQVDGDWVDELYMGKVLKD